jgi:hypothetical protein
VTVAKVKASDVIAADGAGYEIKNNDAVPDGGFLVYKKPGPPTNALQFQFPPSEELTNYPLLHWIAAQGWSVSSRLRSFDNVLYEVSHEETRWDLKQLGRVIRNSVANAPDCPSVFLRRGGDDPKAGPTLVVTDGETRIYVRPALRIDESSYKPDFRLVSVAHLKGAGKAQYVVGDVKGEVYDGWTPSIDNETEFTLLAYLFGQASIDSSKLPIQQLIDVR